MCGQIYTYINSFRFFVFNFMTFDSTWVVLLYIVAAFHKKRMSLSMPRSPRHPRNISAVKAELDHMTKGLPILSTRNQDAACAKL